MLHETDPNLLVLPDFSTAEHEEARIQLVNDGVTDEQAARTLASLWTISNNAAKVHWANRLEQIAAEQRRVEEEEGRCAQVLADEQEAARLEERKKNKTKYTPVQHAEVPSDPTILLAQYAVRKMRAGEFCELFYFTNAGIDDALKYSFIAEPDALVMLTSLDGVPSWVPAAAARDPKRAITKD